MREKDIYFILSHIIVGILVVCIGFLGGMDWMKYQHLKATDIVPKNIRGSYLANYQTVNTKYNQIIKLTDNRLKIENTDYQKHNQNSFDADPVHQTWQKASLETKVKRIIINKYDQITLVLSHHQRFKLKANRDSITVKGQKERTRYLKISNSLANSIITRNNNNQE